MWSANILPGSEPAPSPFEKLAPPAERPDARVVLHRDGKAVGHAAWWWRETPALNGIRTGAIGGFFADSELHARAVLQAATGDLGRRGCRIAVGPMNGNTWRTYRSVSESAGRAPFLLEPRDPVEYAAWWKAADFDTIAEFSSSLMPLSENDPGAAPEAIRNRLEKNGVKIRPLDPERYEEELQAIHALSLRSFAGNFLYTPLSEAEFLASYQKVRERVNPSLVLLAEKEEELVGFVFGIPDLEAEARGEKPALIVKTLAVDPQSRCAGLGSVLVDDLHRAGLEAGFTEAIHALQHQNNSSRRITGRHEGRIFRKYALFGKLLA